MKIDLFEYLRGNEYPGRGIVIGLSPAGNKAMIGYWIMGRSVNSRNRIFADTEDGIRTVAADPAKLTDPHLIIYHPVRTCGDYTIVTNGDQTDTINTFLQEGRCPGFSFEAALNTRTFEDDGPNFTPRISGILDMLSGAFKLSILKSNDGDEASVLRQTFDYPAPKAGEGRFISTYQGPGSPLPSFKGEPLCVDIPTDDGEEWAMRLWEALNKDNRVSLYVRTVDLTDGCIDECIINEYDEAEA